MPKAQSAMEYLLTYGWAILIIAIVFTALYSYGIILHGGVLPSGCTPVSGYTCSQPVLISSGVITAGIGIVGQTIIIHSVGCSANSTTPITWTQTYVTLSSGQISTQAFQCPTLSSGTSGSTFKGTFWINYTFGNNYGGGSIVQNIGQVTVPIVTFTCSAQPVTYNSPFGNPYSVSVPPNCGNVTLILSGASGASFNAGNLGGSGGSGGYISGTYAVTPGNTFYVWAGSAGSSSTAGSPGGGPGNNAGGGCSGISPTNSPLSLTNFIIVAAGGGGAGFSGAGGAGGGVNGAMGSGGLGSAPGAGGTQSSGGIGGLGVGNGASFSGGNGITEDGGGGGCGYYGGGAGNKYTGQDPAGGGGSSNAIAAITNVTNAQGGGSSSNGIVTLLWAN
ncbi:MAG: hypothetical protein KGH94_01440 [Candidatus Micrarchaeota archaeon]|nr:hypothetical protein [Candidatus Micrarchaeota archaeon]